MQMPLTTTKPGRHGAALMLLALACASAAAGCSDKKSSATQSSKDEEPEDAKSLVIGLLDEKRACSQDGRERVELQITAKDKRTIELEVVDRLAVKSEVRQLMTDAGVRTHVASVGRKAVAAGDTLQVMWAFGAAPPAPEPSPDLYPELASAQRDLISDWSGNTMCTREQARIGQFGSSSSVFLASCSGRDYRPHGLLRKARIAAIGKRWAWIAGWVCAPRGANVTLSDGGASWGYQIDSQEFAIEQGPYPAWTLRARLSQCSQGKPDPAPRD